MPLQLLPQQRDQGRLMEFPQGEGRGAGWRRSRLDVLNQRVQQGLHVFRVWRIRHEPLLVGFDGRMGFVAEANGGGHYAGAEEGLFLVSFDAGDQFLDQLVHGDRRTMPKPAWPDGTLKRFIFPPELRSYWKGASEKDRHDLYQIIITRETAGSQWNGRWFCRECGLKMNFFSNLSQGWDVYNSGVDSSGRSGGERI